MNRNSFLWYWVTHSLPIWAGIFIWLGLSYIWWWIALVPIIALVMCFVLFITVQQFNEVQYDYRAWKARRTGKWDD